MDETTTRKRGRDSEDEEELPKESKGLGAHSDSKRKPLTPSSTPAATELVPAAATSAEGPAASTPTAKKTSPPAAPGKPASTTPGVAASQKTAEPQQPEPRRKAPPHIAADFLKRDQRLATNVATKKQLKKTAKDKRSQPAGTPQACSSSSQGAPPATPATPPPPQQAGPRQRNPEASTNLAGANPCFPLVGLPFGRVRFRRFWQLRSPVRCCSLQTAHRVYVEPTHRLSRLPQQRRGVETPYASVSCDGRCTDAARRQPPRLTSDAAWLVSSQGAGAAENVPRPRKMVSLGSLEVHELTEAKAALRHKHYSRLSAK
ncbi:hypothetical protein HPB49_020418 [Dermacentor silvarum]|uniref:Uncharacterized protein n=1 Tax=Dermacentor silvarum TaxID=543639 RepID=A0ACB8E232_DERSI|nr:hypothetical protein HPB49_020418 [Dermacentor silvarum]